MAFSSGPSTVYRNLFVMEKNGWIKCIRNRYGKTYGTTQQGQEIMKNSESIIQEIQTVVKAILRK
jgi:DNA-binding PadR family transcriptional regulator